MANKIQVIIEATTDRATAAVKGFRESIADADTTIGKFKVAGTQAMDLVKQHAGELAMAGGAALVAFGAKSVMAFKDAALEAGRFADATGQTTEDASRWIEVAGDIGVGADEIQSAFIRLEKAAATGSGAFEKYGIEVAKTADGNVDVTGTFLNATEAIQKIPDANERARVSSEIFGRGYANIAELINTSATDVRASLDSVSDAKIIDDEERRKAERLRASLDSLQDTLDDVTLIVGEHLTPVVAESAEKIQDAANAVMAIKDAYDELPGPIRAAVEAQAKLSSGDVGGAMDAITDSASRTVIALDTFTGSAEELRAEMDRLGLSTDQQALLLAAFEDRQKSSTESTGENTTVLEQNTVASQQAASATLAKQQAVEDATAADEEATRAAEAHRAKIDELTSALLQLVGGDIAVRDAQRQAGEAVAAYTAAVDDATISAGDLTATQDAAAKAILNAASAAAENEIATRRAAGETVTVATETRIMGERLSDLASLLDPGSALRQQIEGYIGDLGAIPSEVRTAVGADGIEGTIADLERVISAAERVRTNGQVRVSVGGGGGLPLGRARGGTVGDRGPEPFTLVGEEGPEIASFPSGTRIHTARETQRMLSGRGGPLIVMYGTTISNNQDAYAIAAHAVALGAVV